MPPSPTLKKELLFGCYSNGITTNNSSIFTRFLAEKARTCRYQNMRNQNVHVRILLHCTTIPIAFLAATVASKAQDPVNLPQIPTSSLVQQSANLNQTDFEVPPDVTTQSLLKELVRRRSDTLSDWHPQSDRLYQCGEHRILCSIIPPPPCHPTKPRFHFDLIGATGTPAGGLLYNGPCCPRASSQTYPRHFFRLLLLPKLLAKVNI